MGEISLYASDNEVGGWYFMSLATGKQIYKNGWIQLPMGDKVVQRIKHITVKEGQIIVDNNFTYEWEPGNAIEDMEVRKIDEKEEDELEERTPPKLLKIEMEINHIEEPSENKETFVEDDEDVTVMEEDNVDILDVVNNIVKDEEESINNNEDNS